MESCSSDKELPRFFQPYLPHHSSLNLRIPDAFLDRLPQKIPNRVIIRDIDGKLWPVEVVQTEDGLYFQKGWPKFVFDNSLQMGEFLVFKYNGHHVFEVIVLGINGCDKEVIVFKDDEGGESEAHYGDESMVRETSKNSDTGNLSVGYFTRSKNPSVLSITPKKLKKDRRKECMFPRMTTRLSQKLDKKRRKR